MLAKALAELLSSPGELARARLNLRERTLERFRPEAMVEGTLAVYREVAGRD